MAAAKALTRKLLFQGGRLFVNVNTAGSLLTVPVTVFVAQAGSDSQAFQHRTILSLAKLWKRVQQSTGSCRRAASARAR